MKYLFDSLCFCADINVEEGQLDISLLSSEEANSTLLLIHVVLYHTPIDHVHP